MKDKQEVGKSLPYWYHTETDPEHYTVLNGRCLSAMGESEECILLMTLQMDVQPFTQG